jgi:hypothetical protein
MNAKRTGTVARLPSEARDEINRMLSNGGTYREIIAAMAAKGIKLQKNVLTTWLRGGHQDWLADEERFVKMERIREFALRVVKENQGTAIQEAGLQVAAAQIYELLMEFDPAALKEHLNKGDAHGYAKLVNVMARLSDGGLKHERYRDEVTERKERIVRELEKGKREGMTKARFARIERNLNLL